MAEKSRSVVSLRQGQIIERPTRLNLERHVAVTLTEGDFLAVASHSCDIAAPEDKEPNIECIVARPIPNLDGNYTLGKSHRVLHATIEEPEPTGAIRTTSVEIRRDQILSIPKAALKGTTSDQLCRFTGPDASCFSGWLAKKYSRAAFPDNFNSLLNKRSARIRASLKKNGFSCSGIYVFLDPDRDLKAGEQYSVNLLVTTRPGISNDDYSIAEQTCSKLQDELEKCGFNVQSACRSEDTVSIATIRRFRELDFHDLSLRAGDPLPA